ncbi:MAG: flavin reductase [Candidatus Kapaibacterium sp.]
MRSIDPSRIPAAESHRYLLTCVAPRPIAFVSTQDREGRVNLSPFSFFNAFGANPPIVAFSPAFRGTDGSAKHTFLNIKETGEFTISVVNFGMVEQMSLASADWPEGVDEFEKSGFSKLPSQKISPPGVQESPMVMECKLLQHVDLGGGAASGNLMIGEVVMFHIKESVFDGKYPHHERLDLVARMGGPYYCRAVGDAVFELPKPTGLGIGFDGLPDELKQSRVLTGNHLAKLAGVKVVPNLHQVEEYVAKIVEMGKAVGEGRPDDLDAEMRGGDVDRVALATLGASAHVESNPDALRELFHRSAAWLLDHGNVADAWLLALIPELWRRTT